MPTCSNCGKELKPDASFCTICGTPLTSYRQQPQETPGEPPPALKKNKLTTVAYFFVGLLVVCAALYGISVLYMGYSIRKASTAGYHRFNSGHYIECAKQFRYLTRKAPKNEGNWAMLGECLAAAGEDTEAVRALKSALKWHPASPRLLTLLGIALYNQEKYDAAAKHLLKAIEEDPTNSRPHFHLGLTFEKMNKIRPAIEHLEKALPLMDEDKIKVLEPLGRLYFSLEEYEKSAEKLEEAKEIDPNKYSVRIAACKTYFEMRDFKKALLHCDGALTIRPKSEEAKNLRKQITGSIEHKTELGYRERRRPLDELYLELYAEVNDFITMLNENMDKILGKGNPQIEQLIIRVDDLLDSYHAIQPPPRYFTVHTICLSNVVLLQKLIMDIKTFMVTASPGDRSRFQELANSINHLSRENERLFNVWKAEEEDLKKEGEGQNQADDQEEKDPPEQSGGQEQKIIIKHP